ncbi:hypothetical protein QLQ12_43920 [Actinoplanes sp. NEAU-A12]|uniref:HD domain-containing protein n=1 Tax=Actinoplanes sandaracinus TaxID=3045177 RepID=A0ABT6X0M7_9ACTN|nr:hypothetical protein [Actinoplanes sandaracinus]MDI6105552.1 hypothetical protein [Actinoplanes sandaracinus]
MTISASLRDPRDWTLATGRGALTDQSDVLPLRELPVEAARLLEALQAPPRLAAHLRLVHDVAAALTGHLERRYPDLPFDRSAVLFGAATHDIGKIVHPQEITGPGSAHVPDRLARFAGAHGTWTAPDRTIDDLLALWPTTCGRADEKQTWNTFSSTTSPPPQGGQAGRHSLSLTRSSAISPPTQTNAWPFRARTRSDVDGNFCA